MKDLYKLVRKNIRDLDPYTSAREQFNSKDLVLLDANENPLGAVGKIGGQWDLNRYPDPYQQELKQRISALKGIPAENIVLGNGSDEIIDLLIRIFCEPGKDHIMITSPTYGMYKVAAHINDVEVVEVPLTANFELDSPAIQAEINQHTKILFLCSPNNPTGNLLDRGQIIDLLQSFPGLLVIDEAYIDFAGSASLLMNCLDYPGLAVMQTFSKSWGLAGIRLGMGFASTDICGWYNRIKPPYNVSQLTQQYAIDALKASNDMTESVEEIVAQRNWLTDQLGQLDIVETVYPSDANFVLAKMTNAKKIFSYLIDKNLVVRNRSNLLRCDNCLRITAGSQVENQQLITALKAYSL